MVLKSDYIIYKQCCGSGSKFDGSGSCCHKKTDPDPADIKKTDPDPDPADKKNGSGSW